VVASRSGAADARDDRGEIASTHIVETTNAFRATGEASSGRIVGTGETSSGRSVGTAEASDAVAA
jgi:hypothetical protein